MAEGLQYFLGAEAPGGYIFRMDQLTAPEERRCWVLSGGSARLRGELLRRVARRLEPVCGGGEALLSTEDPARLCGVFFPGRGLAAVDGEAAGGAPLRCPGGCERPVSLWPCADHGALWQRREELLRLSGEERRLTREAAGYLYAAGAMLEELASAGAAALDRGKLLAYARKLARREFSPARGTGTGEERVRFLSALTPGGPVVLRATAAALPRVLAIEDGWGAASNGLLAALRELALAAGQEVVSCYCPLFPFTKLEHLLLPRLGLALVTLNPGNARELAGAAARQIHAVRFCDREALDRGRERCRFLRRAAGGMLEQAGEVMARRGAVRQTLDDIYHGAVDPARAEAVMAETEAEILAAAEG